MKNTGWCRFCGQSFMIELDYRADNLAEDEFKKVLDEAATRRCSCEAAKKYTAIETSKEAVTMTLKERFTRNPQI